MKRRSERSQPGAEGEHQRGSDWGGLWVGERRGSRSSGDRKVSQGCGIVCQDRGLGRASILPPRGGCWGRGTGRSLRVAWANSQGALLLRAAGVGNRWTPGCGAQAAVGTPLGRGSHWAPRLCDLAGGRPGLVPTSSPGHGRRGHKNVVLQSHWDTSCQPT